MSNIDIYQINPDLSPVRPDIDAALANPVSRAVAVEVGREIELVLAIGALREATGQTQEQMAAAADMSQENLSRIERSHDVRWSTIERLARAGNAQIELTAVLSSGERIELLHVKSATAHARKAPRSTPHIASAAIGHKVSPVYATAKMASSRLKASKP